MKILEITYYEDNDIHLKNDSLWNNKNNVNLFEDEELQKSFSNSIYENVNYKECMEYINKHYKNIELIKSGCYSTGWDYKIFQVNE